MSEISEFDKDRVPAHLSAAAVDIVVGLTGEPAQYVPRTYTTEQSWQFLSAAQRQWALENAQPRVRDPRSGVETLYWDCRVEPLGHGGPPGVAVEASYELVMFGLGGLVVASGTTRHLVGATGATKWRHTRFALPADPAGLRQDHFRGVSTQNQMDGMLAGVAIKGGTQLLPAGFARTFGNLPLQTQHFMCAPFLSRRTPMTHCKVHATTNTLGYEYRETYWVYLFDKSRFAFAHAYRSVQLVSGQAGPALWNGSPEAAALVNAEWDVAAWTSPVGCRPSSLSKMAGNS